MYLPIEYYDWFKYNIILIINRNLDAIHMVGNYKTQSCV